MRWAALGCAAVIEPDGMPTHAFARTALRSPDSSGLMSCGPDTYATRTVNDPMLEFYRDTFASQAAKDQPIFDMKKVATTLDGLLEVPADQRIAVESGLQRVASVVAMQELFSMA